MVINIYFSKINNGKIFNIVDDDSKSNTEIKITKSTRYQALQYIQYHLFLKIYFLSLI